MDDAPVDGNAGGEVGSFADVDAEVKVMFGRHLLRWCSPEIRLSEADGSLVHSHVTKPQVRGSCFYQRPCEPDLSRLP